MCIEHHHDADDLVRQTAEFRREGCDEPRAVRLLVGGEAAGRGDLLQVRAPDAAKIDFYRRKVTKHRALARASPTTDLSMRINALPTELVWKIISFWRTARDAPGNLLD